MEKFSILNDEINRFTGKWTQRYLQSILDKKLQAQFNHKEIITLLGQIVSPPKFACAGS